MKVNLFNFLTAFYDQKCGTSFYLKKRANSQEEKFPVYVRITCDGQRAELATGQKIQPKLWNPSEERAKGKSDAVNKLNGALNAVELKINDTIRYLKDCSEEFNIEKIYQ